MWDTSVRWLLSVYMDMIKMAIRHDYTTPQHERDYTAVLLSCTVTTVCAATSVLLLLAAAAAACAVVAAVSVVVVAVVVLCLGD